MNVYGMIQPIGENDQLPLFWSQHNVLTCIYAAIDKRRQHNPRTRIAKTDRARSFWNFQVIGTGKQDVGVHMQNIKAAQVVKVNPGLQRKPELQGRLHFLEHMQKSLI